MIIAAFFIGAICGAGAVLWVATWFANSKPKDEPHIFSAISTADYGSAWELRQVFKNLESGHD
jgi:hypothetical protein